ncbi:hypothetical protein GCK72_025979 [Caenorhabditis remanei]|uniref:DUF38 domain-containing protein n=1 Tax=Caenorhabditis remanei TaxID=31234 RepID=A0A6A5G459_CAERE|nr:hypothetical protein GCK72_025979 [Caenorhabditis remanei]KAF1749511.1 hypothetical protein GCK72_025979 [Caenorhabditis remanei]
MALLPAIGNVLRNIEDERSRFKHWTKLPDLVKILTLKMMTLSEQIALSSLSKKSRALTNTIPCRIRVLCVRSVGIDETQLLYTDGESNSYFIEVEDIWTRLSLPKSAVYRVIIGTPEKNDNDLFGNFISKVKKCSRQDYTIKPRFLVWYLNEKNVEFVNQLMPFFGSSSGTFNQPVYECISSSTQWTVCKKLFVSMENVQINEASQIDVSQFNHFNQLTFEVSRIDGDSIKELIENLCSGRYPIRSKFFIGCFNGIPIADVVPQQEGPQVYAKFFAFPHDVIGYDDWVVAVVVGRKYVQAVIVERDGWENRYGKVCWHSQFNQCRTASHMENAPLPSGSEGFVSNYNLD